MPVDKSELIDFDKIIINNTQLKMLKMFKFKERINTYQFHGYFKFPNFTDILISIQDLEKLGLVYQDDFSSPPDYLMTNNGEKYLLFLKRNSSKKAKSFISILAALSTVLGFLLSVLKN